VDVALKIAPDRSLKPWASIRWVENAEKQYGDTNTVAVHSWKV
jgi:hypothetical protein